MASLVGFTGHSIAYEHEPLTNFQRQCRDGTPSRDIQHYTKAMPDDKVER
jgi:hypothetical protein